MTTRIYFPSLAIARSGVLGLIAAMTATMISSPDVHAQTASGQVDRGQTIAIMDGEVHTVTGTVIEAGDVIIRGGRIVEVGSDLTAPDGAQIINADGRIVTPGIIAPFSSLGLAEISAVADSNDAGPDRSFELGASLDAGDAFNPASTLIPINRAGGVTRAVSVPNVGGSLFGGKAIFVDLTGEAGSVFKRDVGQTLILNAGGANRAGGTRMGAYALAREMLEEAQLFANDPAGYRRLVTDGRYTVSDLRALGPVLSGEVPLFVVVHRAVDIRNVIRMKSDFGLNIILVGAAEGWREAAALAAANVPVIIDGLANLPQNFETLSATLRNAALLNQAGVTIGFYNPQGFGDHNLRLLPQMAGNAVAEGLPFDAALAALTLGPATMFGLDGEMGSLEAGKRADVVVWDGDPLEVTSAPVAVLIDGKVQDLNNRQQMLLDRYRTLDRGTLPHAYRGAN
ncbi:MAG: amidohydrolase family protein [Pseudomonadota bacterium]